MNEPKSNVGITVSAGPEPHTHVVQVRARTTTQHRVTVRPAYLQELGVAGASAPEVLQKSFEFLLEREPNTSILSTFDLREIERYFPEFRQEIPRRLQERE
jgi:hypothetical protein